MAKPSKKVKQSFPLSPGRFIVLVLALALGIYIGVSKPSNWLRPSRADVSANLQPGTVSVSGKVSTLVGDNFKSGKSEQQYYLESSTGAHYRVDLTQSQVKPSDLNRNVKVDGYFDGQTITARKVSPAGLLNLVNPALAAAKTHKTLVIMFDFESNPVKPMSIAQARDLVFTGQYSLNQYYSEASFGQVNFAGYYRAAGDVTGWYTIHQPTTPCNPWSWSAEADDLAKQAGFDVNNFNNVIYIYPGEGTTCDFQGWGSMTDAIGRSWVSRWSWDNDRSLSSIIQHEVGHNFNMDHAHYLSCQDTTGKRVPLSSNCTTEEYGDYFSPMGYGYWLHMINYHKALSYFDFASNWLKPENQKDVTRNGTYILSPIETPTSGYQLLRIRRTISPITLDRGFGPSDGYDYFYVEYRRPLGFDGASDGPAGAYCIQKYPGVLIRMHEAYASDFDEMWNRKDINLIDMNPGAANSVGDWCDSALGKGREFRDAQNGISIIIPSYGVLGTTAPVQVKFDPPTVAAITPAQGSVNGGYKATITGKRLLDYTGRAYVNFGTKSMAAKVLYGESNENKIVIMVPAYPAADLPPDGRVDVKFRNDFGPVTLTGGFQYLK